MPFSRIHHYLKSLRFPFLLGLSISLATSVGAQAIALPGDATDGDPIETGLGQPENDSGHDADWFVSSDTTRPGGGVYSFQSGDIGNRDYSSMTLVMAEDGNLSFFWKVSSEENYDFLEVFLNGGADPVADISGEQNWAEVTIPVSAGDEITWVYFKDGSESDGADAGWVDGITLLPPTLSFTSPSEIFGIENTTEIDTIEAAGADLTYSLAGGSGADQSAFTIGENTGALSFVTAPTYSPPGDSNGDNVYEVEIFVSDAVDTISQVFQITLLAEYDPLDPNLLPITFSGDADWLVVDDNSRSGGGSFSLQAGDIDHREISEISVTVPSNGELSFYWKVSSEQNYDYLQYYINSDFIDETSGNRDWEEVTLLVSAGDIITWAYEKDGSDSGGADTGWIDGVTLTLLSLDFVSPTTEFSFEGSTAGPTIQASGDGAVTYSLVGGLGADQDVFSIDENTGELSFKAAPVYSPARDDNEDNVYEVEVFATDSIETISETFRVTLTPESDPIDSDVLPLTLSGDADWAVIEDDSRIDGGNFSLQAGDIGDDQYAAMSVAVPIAGDLTFYWKVDSERDFDFLQVFVNAEAEPRSRTSGDQDWEKMTLTLAAGDTVTWVYEKDGDKTEGQDTGWIDGVSFRSFALAFDSPNVVYGFEGGHAGPFIEAGGIGNVTFSLAGGSGADQAAFTIDENTGQLSFISAPSYSPAGDDNGDNVYEVEVFATDSVETISQTFEVALTPELDPIDSEVLPLSYDGDANWSVVVDDTRTDGGDYSLRAGEIGDDEYSAISLTVPYDGKLSFFWKVSSENGFDFLQYYINAETEPTGRTSGEADWEEVSLFLEAGDTVTWVYLKDDEDADYADTAWIDGISFGPIVLEFDSPTLLYAFEGGTSGPTIDAYGNGDVSYSLAGGSGVDQAAFTIDEDTGMLSFVAAPMYTPAGDANGDNVYEVEVTINDDFETVSQIFQVTLTRELDPMDVDLLPLAYSGDADWKIVLDDSRSGGGIYSLQAGDINDGETSVISATVPSDGELSFFWKVSSERRYDFLQFFNNSSSEPYDEISGSEDWEEITLNVEKGDTISWVYEKDFREYDGMDTGWVDRIDYTPFALHFNSASTIFGFENAKTAQVIEASGVGDVAYSLAGGSGADQGAFNIDENSGLLRFNSAPAYLPAGDANGDNVYEVEVFITDSVETISQVFQLTLVPEMDPIQASLLPYTLDGQADWSLVSDSTRSGGGLYSFKSGDIESHEYTSISVTAPANGYLSFFWKVSSEEGADFLQVFVNDEAFPRAEISGIVDWEELSILLEIGDTVTWRYVKDGRDSENDDAGWVDGISFESSTVVQIVDPNTDVPVLQGVAEVTTVTATGPNLGSITYTLVGGAGADQTAFTIDSNTGVLSFVAIPAYDPAGDADGDNVYEVEVIASDGLSVDSRTLEVTLAPTRDPIQADLLPYSVAGNGSWELVRDDSRPAGGNFSLKGQAPREEYAELTITIPENGELIYYQKVSSNEGDHYLRTYVNGSGFSRNSISGLVDWHEVRLTLSAGDEVTWAYDKSDDSASRFEDAAWIDGIKFVPDGNVILQTSNLLLANLGRTDVATIEASSSFPGDITYSLVDGNGADQTLLTIDEDSGLLSFISLPVYDPAGDANGDNHYEVEVTASDGVTSDSMLYDVRLLPFPGDGSSDSPYEVDSLEDLIIVSATSELWDRQFIQSADIDATASASLNEGLGFDPIEHFTGVYDGYFYVIDGLTVNRPTEGEIGSLFAVVDDAIVRNVILENVSVTAFDNAGGLSGEILGDSYVDFCSVSGTVTATESSGEAGGFVSKLDHNSVISQCAAAVDVVGGEYVGGFVAELDSGLIVDCYATGNVADFAGSDDARIASFCGDLSSSGSILRCYGAGLVTSVNADRAEGFVADISQSFSDAQDSFWDIESTGQVTDDSDAGVIGLTTAQMRMEANYLAVGWDFESVWSINEGASYPVLQWQGITQAYLQWIEDNELTLGDDAAPGYDAAGDGIPNIIKFAFNLDPAVSGASQLVVIDGSNFTPGLEAPYLSTSPFNFSARFVRLKNYAAAGLSYTVEFSSDLINWQPTSATPTVVSDNGGDYEVVEVPRPFFVGNSKALFFRISVVFE